MPAPSAPTCPDNSGSTYTGPSGKKFVIECFMDRAGGDMPNQPVYVSSFQQCIDTCDSTAACVAVSRVGAACYMKSAQNNIVTNGAVWGARLASGQASTSPAPATSSSSSSSSSSSIKTSSSTSSTPVQPTGNTVLKSCPEADKQTFLVGSTSYMIKCGEDTVDNDVAAYDGVTLKECLDRCSLNANCNDLSYTGNSCYLKSKSSSVNTNPSVTRAIKLGGGVIVPSSSGSNQVSSSSFGGGDGGGVIIPSSSSSPTTMSSAAAPTSTGGFPILCDTQNNTIYTTSCNARYAVECGIDRSGGDLSGNPTYTTTLAECAALCDQRSECVDASWIKGSLKGACYLKGAVGAKEFNSGIQTVRQLSKCTIGSAPPGLEWMDLGLEAKKEKAKRKLHKEAQDSETFGGPDTTLTSGQDLTVEATITRTAYRTAESGVEVVTVTASDPRPAVVTDLDVDTTHVSGDCSTVIEPEGRRTRTTVVWVTVTTDLPDATTTTVPPRYYEW
ncbi:hypothetical protein K402DRAFT_416473 [Aulographum hederae CBS 113979]|uniref:Apple domain-containing protein n=1 Tax=Aulographum hederae CBS 113979 TaxID=1176131 RepID=A0A6G1HFG5_9PEZI|nr:hypothetical protein K402DRAFT_416473 [Aulographum hederae CBS 113979]